MCSDAAHAPAASFRGRICPSAASPNMNPASTMSPSHRARDLDPRINSTSCCNRRPAPSPLRARTCCVWPPAGTSCCGRWSSRPPTAGSTSSAAPRAPRSSAAGSRSLRPAGSSTQGRRARAAVPSCGPRWQLAPTIPGSCSYGKFELLFYLDPLAPTHPKRCQCTWSPYCPC